MRLSEINELIQLKTIASAHALRYAPFLGGRTIT